MKKDLITINIDVGGTFTDGFFVWGDKLSSAKVPTTGHDLTVGFMECIERGAEKMGTDLSEFLAKASMVRFSTTMGTNAIIEKKGMQIGLLVTSGQEEKLYSVEGEFKVNDYFVKPNLIEGIEEEIDIEGKLIREPKEEQTLKAVKRLQESGARMVVISLENSYWNNSNEREVKRLIQEEYPRHYLGSVPTLTSFEVSSRPDDYRRLNTAVGNAYIHRPMKVSLYRAEDKIRSHSYNRPLFIGHSSGGVAAVAKTRAIDTLNSGPVAGVFGVKALSEEYQMDIIGADMGGTSLDLSIVKNGELPFELSHEIEGLPTHIPSIAVQTIGAGGGSIAKMEQGEIQIGPESVGGNPGPACFGKGGKMATVTDADVVLGRISSEFFLGGRLELSVDKARKAIERHVVVGRKNTAEEAAEKVIIKVEQKIKNAITGMDSKGIDTIVAYGGAGPMHMTGLVKEKEIKRMIVTPHSAIFSAFGESMMGILHTYTRPLWEKSNVETLVGQMKIDAEKDMRSEGFSLEEIKFDIDAISYDPDGRIDEFVSVSEKRKKNELATLRLHARGDAPISVFTEGKCGGEDPSSARIGEREVVWRGEKIITPIFAFEKLHRGAIVKGPAIIESVDTTIPVVEGTLLRVDALGNGIIGSKKSDISE